MPAIFRSLCRNSCAGLAFFGLGGVVLHARSASSKSSLSSLHLSNRCLQVLTAFSAKPFDSGLYAEASSCCTFNDLQNSWNGCLNCGPPSVLIRHGMPSWHHHVLRCWITAAVVVDVSRQQNGNPEYLSTMTRYVAPAASNKSTPTSDMGKVSSMRRACFLLAGSRCCLGFMLLQALHWSHAFAMSLAMLGQYTWRLASACVLRTPLWLMCSMLMISFLAGCGMTNLLVSYIKSLLAPVPTRDSS